MNRIPYVLYGLWAVLAIVLKIVGVVGWWVATSWLWLPLGCAISFFFIVSASVHIGKWLDERRKSKIPDSCETCLWYHARTLNPEGKCMGQVLEDTRKIGELCPSYKRDVE